MVVGRISQRSPDEAKRNPGGRGLRTSRIPLRSMRATFLAGSQAPDLIVIHKSRRAKNAVIPAWMPESSAVDGNLPLAQVLDLGNVPARSFTSL